MPLEQMDFPASYQALRPVVEHEYFDHRAVPQLEEYLDEQVETRVFCASRRVLCLHCFPAVGRHFSVAFLSCDIYSHVPEK